MRKQLLSKIKDLDYFAATAFEAVDAEQVADSCRSTIDAIRAKALRAGLPDVVAATQRPGGGIKWAREVLAACLAALPDRGDTLSVPEIAKQLNTSADTIRGWIKSGQLKASNVATGNRPRYIVARDDLNLFLKTRQPEKPVKRKRKAKLSSDVIEFF